MLDINGITYLIDKALSEQAKEIKVDYVDHMGRSGFSVTSEMNLGGGGFLRKFLQYLLEAFQKKAGPERFGPAFFISPWATAMLEKSAQEFMVHCFPTVLRNSARTAVIFSILDPSHALREPPRIMKMDFSES